jgi:hypothetical protein
MLKNIKSDISRLRSSQRVAERQKAQEESPAKKPEKPRKPVTPKTALDKMHEIELLLLETEESLANMSSRMDSTEMMIRNRTAML